MSKGEFLERTRKHFGERYDYSLFDELPPLGQKLPIRCQVHEQVFLQEARNHLRGHVGCLGCISQKLSGPRGERGELRTPDVLTTKLALPLNPTEK